MTTDLTTYSFHQSVPTEFYRWAPIDDTRLKFIKQTIAKGATDIELQEFVNLCDNLHLSPFTRPAQIWFIKRREMVDGSWKDAFSVQVGIAGYRAIAARTGLYGGSTQPEFCGQPRDPEAEPLWRSAWLFDDPPAAARVGVWIRGAILPTFRVATWREFAQWHGSGDSRKLNSLWAKFPSYMLAKCAEAAALRAGFPEETAGAERYFSVADEGQRFNAIEPEPRQIRSVERLTLPVGRVSDLYAEPPADAVPRQAEPAPDPTRRQPRMTQAAAVRPPSAAQPASEPTREPDAETAAAELTAMQRFWSCERTLKGKHGWTDDQTLQRFAPRPADWAQTHGGWAAAADDLAGVLADLNAALEEQPAEQGQLLDAPVERSAKARGA